MGSFEQRPRVVAGEALTLCLSAATHQVAVKALTLILCAAFVPPELPMRGPVEKTRISVRSSRLGRAFVQECRWLSQLDPEFLSYGVGVTADAGAASLTSSFAAS